MQFNETENPRALKLSGVLKVSAADELHAVLDRYVQANHEVRLDVSEVEACDITAIQLLYSAEKTAKGTGKLFLLGEPSAAMVRAFEDCGVNPRTR